MRISGLLRQLRAGLLVLVVLTVVTGLCYPLAVWGVSRVPGLQSRAEGSVVSVDGKDVGSSLIGLNLVDPNAKDDPTKDRFFHNRPSAGASDYSTGSNLGLADNDGSSSGASNLSGDSDKLAQQVTQRRQFIAKREGVDVDQVPVDAVTASASGLDPDVSPAYAQLQIARVARNNGLSTDQVTKIVADHTVGRSLGFVGEPHVNVGDLNVAIAQLKH